MISDLIPLVKEYLFDSKERYYINSELSSIHCDDHNAEVYCEFCGRYIVVVYDIVRDTYLYSRPFADLPNNELYMFYIDDQAFIIVHQKKSVIILTIDKSKLGIYQIIPCNNLNLYDKMHHPYSYATYHKIGSTIYFKNAWQLNFTSGSSIQFTLSEGFEYYAIDHTTGEFYFLVDTIAGERACFKYMYNTSTQSFDAVPGNCFLPGRTCSDSLPGIRSIAQGMYFEYSGWMNVWNCSVGDWIDYDGLFSRYPKYNSRQCLASGILASGAWILTHGNSDGEYCVCDYLVENHQIMMINRKLKCDLGDIIRAYRPTKDIMWLQNTTTLYAFYITSDETVFLSQTVVHPPNAYKKYILSPAMKQLCI